MAEETKITKTTLPNSYTGRCKEGDYFSTFVSKPGDKTEKFELRLPIPGGKNMKDLEASCQELYKKPVSFIILRGVKALATDVDDRAKKLLFQQDEKTGAWGDYTPEAHLAAQGLVDKWEPATRVAGKGNFDQIVLSLKKAGALRPEDDPQNKEELEEMVKANLNF